MDERGAVGIFATMEVRKRTRDLHNTTRRQGRAHTISGFSKHHPKCRADGRDREERDEEREKEEDEEEESGEEGEGEREQKKETGEERKRNTQ